MSTLGRVTSRALLLGGGAATAWLLSAALHSPTASAAPIPEPVPASTALLGGVIAPLPSLLPAIEQAAPVTSPILGPVESLITGIPTSGRIRPLLAPIQGPPTVSDPTGVLLIAPTVHRLAEPTDALLAGESRTAARAMMALSPGSVPGTHAALPASPSPQAPLPGTNPGPNPALLVLPPLPSSPLVPPEPVTGATGDPSTGTGGATQHRADTDRELPVPGATESLLGTRSPPVGRLGALLQRADDPTFAPD
jgi:hypothetical protein